MLKTQATPRQQLARGISRLRRCLPFWRRSLAVFVLAALVSVPFSISGPRVYRSETVVLYHETIRSADVTGANGDGMLDNARRVGARLRETLLSRANLEAVIRELHMYTETVEQRGLVDAVDEMRKHITFRAREGETFEIAFEGTSPEQVQEVTKRLANSIVKEAAARRAAHAGALKDFVDVESERNEAALKEREAALAGFLAVHPEFKRRAGSDVAAPSQAPVAALSLAALEQEASRITQQLAAPPRAASAGAVAPAPAATADVPPDVAAARRDLADKLARYTDRHPDVLAARARLQNVENAHAAIAAERAAFDEAPAATAEGKSRTEDDRELLRARLAAVQQQIAARRAAAPPASASASAAVVAEVPSAAKPAGSVEVEVEFRRLLREVHEAQERQRQLDESQFRASLAASSVMNDRNIQVSVLDPAYLPTHPVSRPRSTLLAVALLFSLFLALLTAGLSAWFDDRILSREDIADIEAMPLIGVIPRPVTVRRLRRSNDG